MNHNVGGIWKTLVLALAATASQGDPGRTIAADDAAKRPAAGKAASETPAARDWIELFGINEGKPVDSGFLFYDGRYVEAPYRVSRRGVGLYVNDSRFPGSGFWPPDDLEDKDPGPPPGLTRNSKWSDLLIKGKPGGSWDGVKLRWLKRHYKPEEASRLFIQYLKDLPFVAKVEVVSRNELKITTHGGEIIETIGLAAAPWFPPTKEQVLEELERRRRRLERRLQEGDCILMFESGSEISFGQERAARELPVAVEILSSKRSDAEKADLLERIGIWEPSPTFLKLVTQFQPSAQLTERLRALSEKTGIKPRTMQEIPAETLRQIMERIKKKELLKKKSRKQR